MVLKYVPVISPYLSLRISDCRVLFDFRWIFDGFRSWISTVQLQKGHNFFQVIDMPIVIYFWLLIWKITEVNMVRLPKIHHFPDYIVCWSSSPDFKFKWLLKFSNQVMNFDDWYSEENDGFRQSDYVTFFIFMFGYIRKQVIIGTSIANEKVTVVWSWPMEIHRNS